MFGCLRIMKTENDRVNEKERVTGSTAKTIKDYDIRDVINTVVSSIQTSLNGSSKIHLTNLINICVACLTGAFAVRCTICSAKHRSPRVPHTFAYALVTLYENCMRYALA